MKSVTKNLSAKAFRAGTAYLSVLPLVCLILCLSGILSEVKAEGSGNWGVTANRQANLFIPSAANNGNGSASGNTGYNYRGYMMLASDISGNYKPEHRLYVWVKDGETVFWGFHQDGNGDNNIQFTWYYDNNSTTGTGLGHFPTATTYGNGRRSVQQQAVNVRGSSGTVQGRPNDASAATQGPYQVTGSGYSARSFKNETGADRAFWVEINSNNLEFNYWDITVASGSSGSYSRKNGRVYCKYWSVVNELPSQNQNPMGQPNNNSFPTNFGFYIPVDNEYTTTNDDFFVKYANFGRSNAGYALFFANNKGPGTSGNFETDRRSVAGASNQTKYPLFLNNPDINVWRSSLLPVWDYSTLFKKRADSDTGGEAFFTVTVDTPSIVDILIDLYGNDQEYGPGDVLISYEFKPEDFGGNPTATKVLYWNGKDGNNNDVPPGTNVYFISSLAFFPVHFPIFDMEQSLGIHIKHVRPIRGGGDPTDDVLYWDDRNISRNNIPDYTPSTLSPRSVSVNLTGLPSPNHIWWANGDNGFSQNNTINTWTGAFNDGITRSFKFQYDTDIDLAVTKSVSPEIAEAGQTVTFTIKAENLAVATNLTDVIATGVVVEDIFPDGYNVVSVDVTKGTWDGVNKKWLIGTLEVGEEPDVVMTVTAKVNSRGNYLNTARIYGNENDVNPENNQDDAKITTVAIRGNVFNDPDAGNVNNSTGVANQIPAGLWANLVDASNKVVASVSVGTNGEYSFTAVPGTYTVTLSNLKSVEDEAPLSYTPPVNWINTGAFNGEPNTGNSGNLNGVSAAFTVTNEDKTNINFAIQHRPTAYDELEDTQNNPGADISVAVDPELFTGTDVHGGYITKIIITGFPTNATSITIGGTKYYTLEEIQTAYPNGIDAGSGGNPVPEIKIDPVDGDVSVEIPFKVLDNGGGYSEVAKVTLPFVVPEEPGMPVNLAYFKAGNVEGSVLLQWRSEKEQNTAGFTIEHSADARSWQTLGWVPSVNPYGNSVKATDYRFEHVTPFEGINYYRLKMTDLDQTYSYSDIINLKIKEGESRFAVYPVPVTDQANIRIKGISDWKGVSGIRIYDLNGRVVKSVDSPATDEVSVSNLPGGVYLVVAEYKNGQRLTSRLLIQR